MSSSSPLQFPHQSRSTAATRRGTDHHQQPSLQQNRALDYSIGNRRHVISQELQQLTPASKSDISASMTADCTVSPYHHYSPLSAGNSLSPSQVSCLLSDVFYKYQRSLVDHIQLSASGATLDRRLLVPSHASLAAMMPSHLYHLHLQHQHSSLPQQLVNLPHGHLSPQFVQPHSSHHIHNLQYLNQFHHQHPQQHEEPKPMLSYIGLIAMAILGSAERKLVLSDIYQWILDHYPYFRHRGPGWRNSIRHNLSLNDCFIKAARSANGKGHYWAVHPANIEDFERGDFRRRRAQRKVRRAMGLTVLPDDNDDDLDSPAPSPASYFRSMSSALPGNQSAAAAAAMATVLRINRSTAPAASAAVNWIMGCGLPKNDLNLRAAVTEAIGESSGCDLIRNINESPPNSTWSSPEAGRNPTAERIGSTSTKRRLFDMDSILALDECGSQRTSAIPPGQHSMTSVQGHDGSQHQERDLYRHEQVEEIVEIRTSDDYMIASSCQNAEDTNTSWYSDKASLSSSCGDGSIGTANQLMTSMPIH